MDLTEILSRKEEIKNIAEKYGAHNVRVFGSFVRGEAHPESDVDFLIDLERGRSFFDRVSIQLELEEMLGCRVDVVSARGLKARVRERVLEEAQLL